VVLWDTVTDTELGRIVDINPTVLEFSPDGKVLAIGCQDNTVRLWDLKSSKSVVLSGHKKPVWAIAFSPDSRTIVTGSQDTTAKLWDIGSHWELITLRGHHEAVRSVAFSSDGKTLATGSDDKTVRLWYGQP
jgi:WD40 repeat protein